MEEALNKLKNAMENTSAVERYEKGYREERKAETDMDRALKSYKETLEKRERLERCVFSA